MQLTCPHCQQVLQFSGKRPAFCAYCGKALPTPNETSTIAFDGAGAAADLGADPPEIGGYRLVRLVGEGGMGRVYEAEETAGGRRVALKLISAEFAASPAAVERFRREGRLASGVSHPRCVFVLAADEAGGRPYIVMELMPGTTLQDLVDRDGPLPVQQALTKILDVIEGLGEAHRLGVLHRDVKPANCFLDAEGRVKVGDFGLSKSLVNSDALTRTGSFIGTPLFASPEQIKGEAVGPQSDVYSTAATLYCLLTGRAPFQGGDPAATLARIVSDAAPPMRSLRPDLPAALDLAVQRGLERDPARRWRNLEEFRAALLPFVPGRLSIGGLGIRFGAFVIDYVCLVFLSLPLFLLSLALTGGESLWEAHIHPETQLVQLAAGLVVWGLYFGGCEALWGCTPGKRWLGLRVYRANAAERPSAAAVFLRTGLLFLLLNFGSLAFQAMLLGGAVDPANRAPENQLRLALLAGATFYPLEALGIVLLLCPMRARNGYRGLHEWLSGSRVVRLPDVVRRRGLPGRSLELDTTPPDGLPTRLGPYDVQGVLATAGQGRLVVGHDAALGRRAWIWLRPAGDTPLSAARREINRTTRLRWLAGGQDDAFQWDAFLAPEGCVLPRAAARSLSWAETRHLLSQLAEELTEAGADGTLPAALSTGHVWVRPDGAMTLLDVAVGPPTDATDASVNSQLALLGRTAILALEGKPPPAVGLPSGVRAPLPLHASAMLGRLFDLRTPYVSVREFRAALAAAADKPAETTRARRLAHLAVLTAFLSIGLCAGLSPLAFIPSFSAIFDTAQIRQLESLRERLGEVAAQDAASALGGEPLLRPPAIQQIEEDARLDAGLVRALEGLRQRRQARLDAQNWLARGYALAVEKQTAEIDERNGSMKAMLPPASQPALVRGMAGQPTSGLNVEDQAQGLAIVQTVMLLIWPAAWIVWAFLFRGGLSLPLMGLALVRWNGRPALRVQCAWRAVLMWAPIVGLAVASAWLDAVYWSRWNGESSDAWMLWAASAAWWATLGLLPLYVVLAIRFPRRSLHDWLAGTYVVPR